MQEKNKFSVSQVMIALDAGGCDESTFTYAISLASNIQAEVCGLYIEDSNLINTAALPHTREITFHTARLREINVDIIHKSLNDIANELKNLLENLGKQTDARTSFRRTRGLRIPKALEESRHAQFIIIPAPATRQLTRKQQTDRDKLSFAIFYDNKIQAQKIINIVLSLAEKEKIQLIIFTCDIDANQNARKLFRNHDIDCKFINYSDRNHALTLLKSLAPRLIIVSDISPLIDSPEHIHQLNYSVNCDLIIVR